ncbi:MAG: type II CRISPR-associated endonuclease Cas1, partial [Sediminibacterium sp.]|nr:type II CRISPR-associated endonuclease Cas1 [Sediminibacterium sp.]
EVIATKVVSGDKNNKEAQAATYYWQRLFPAELQFTRNPEGFPPNNLLNYGYAILRALVARSLVGSGLLPTLGIFHRNQYNAYCLADDIMEPYRPVVDSVVCQFLLQDAGDLSLTVERKKELLQISYQYVFIKKEKASVFNAIQRTTASLSKCFEGSQRRILYPTLMPIIKK